MAKKAVIEHDEMRPGLTLLGLGRPGESTPLVAALACIGWSWIDFDWAYRLSWTGTLRQKTAVAETIALLVVHGYEVEGPAGERKGPCLVDPSAPLPYDAETIAQVRQGRHAIGVRRMGWSAGVLVAAISLPFGLLLTLLSVADSQHLQLGLREFGLFVGCCVVAWVALRAVFRRSMSWLDEQEPRLPEYDADDVLDLQDLNAEWAGQLKALEVRRHEAAESCVIGQDESTVAAQAIWDFADQALRATRLEDEVVAAATALDSSSDHHVADAELLRTQLNEANEALRAFRAAFAVETAAFEARLVEASETHTACSSRVSGLAHSGILVDLTTSLRCVTSTASAAEPRPKRGWDIS